MALGEITVAWLGNFGTLPFFGPGDFPAWGPLPRPQDAVRQPHFVHLSQPPPGTLKLRFYWGNEDSSGLITFSMVEFNMPDPPPGFEQQFVGLDPPGPGKVELQIDVNVGPTLPGGPDMQYWSGMRTPLRHHRRPAAPGPTRCSARPRRGGRSRRSIRSAPLPTAPRSLAHRGRIRVQRCGSRS
jgi:hypothetical protein